MNNKGFADKVLMIPCQSLQGFFEQWFNLLKPVHKLSNKEIQLIATIVRFRYELSLKITDKELLDEVLMSTDTKQKIREACGISKQSYQVSMFKLKKAKVLISDDKDDDGPKLYKVNPKLIPSFNGKDFKLLLYFDLIDGQGQDIKDHNGTDGTTDESEAVTSPEDNQVVL